MLLCRTSGRKTLSRWPKEMLQRHPKALLKDVNIHGNRLHRIEQSGVASLQKGTAQYEAKRIGEAERSAENAQQEPRDHHQHGSIQSEITFSIYNR